MSVQWFTLVCFTLFCQIYPDFLFYTCFLFVVWIDESIARLLLTRRKLRKQLFLAVKLKSTFRTFYGGHVTWLTVTNICIWQWPRICSLCRNHNLTLSSFVTNHHIFHKTNVVKLVSLVEYELLTLLEHLSSPKFLVGFVLLNR